MSIETCVGQFYHRNQMTSAVDSATDGGTPTQRVTYVYDALGNRIESDSWDGSTTTVQRYGMDGWDPAKPSPVGNENFDTWVQLDGSNALVRRRVTGVDANEQIARQTAGGVVNWYLLDRQNSVMEVIDSTATVVASTTYDAYGNVTTGALSDRFGYNGMEFDSITSDYFDRARVYDPKIGQFTSEDVKFPGTGTNPFEYAGNAPTNWADPSGDIYTLVLKELAKQALKRGARGAAKGGGAAGGTGAAGGGAAGGGAAVAVADALGAVALAEATLAADKFSKQNGGAGMRSARQLDAQDGRTVWESLESLFSSPKSQPSGAVGGIMEKFNSGAVKDAVDKLNKPVPKPNPNATPTPETYLPFPEKNPFAGTECEINQDQKYKPKGCFAAGTPIQTPEGWRNIEQIRAGDMVLSRDEFDPSGIPASKVVEELFVTNGLVWHLHAGGQVIRTSAEHPFFVATKGWMPCNELKVGDRLLCADRTWVAVEDLLDTGEWETVYNFRVADFHTYFIGCDEWGFSVWAHNACAIVYWYPLGTFDDKYPHLSVETITDSGKHVHTERVYDGAGRDTSKGTIIVGVSTVDAAKATEKAEFNLPDGDKAQAFQESVKDKPSPLPWSDTNNCFSHVADVLSAGGIPIVSKTAYIRILREAFGFNPLKGPK